MWQTSFPGIEKCLEKGTHFLYNIHTGGCSVTQNVEEDKKATKLADSTNPNKKATQENDVPTETEAIREVYIDPGFNNSVTCIVGDELVEKGHTGISDFVSQFRN